MWSEVDCFSVMFSRMHVFMKKGLFTDVTFIFPNGSQISAHKSVLAACSTVFETMFQSSFSEGMISKVEVNDVNEEVFTAFLDYVYLRDAKVVKKHVNQLSMMADKYDVEALALLCDGFVEASLTPRNAVDSLLLANLYRRNDLITKIGRFFKIKLLEISMHPSWTKLGDHFDVMTGLVHSFIQSYDDRLCQKFSNSVTWTLLEEECHWYDEKELRPWEVLTLIDVNPKIVFNVTLSAYENRIAVHIKAENQLCEDFPSAFSISARCIFGENAHTKICLSWPPKSSEYLIFIPCYHNEKMEVGFVTPMVITVVVQQSATEQYQLIEKVERNSRFLDAIITLTDSGRKIRAHKLVLSNCSPFFSSLLKDNQKQYEIPGIGDKTFSTLLDYMYSLSNPSPRLVDLNLLRGAKLFELDRLVEFCVSTLRDDIRHDNAVEICTAGEKLGLNELVIVAMDYMKENPSPILNSTEWSRMERHPRLIKELLFKLGAKRDCSLL